LSPKAKPSGSKASCSSARTTFTIDALGRQTSRTVGTEDPVAYAYLGTSAQVSSTATDDGQSVTLDSYSAIDAIGNRISTGLSSQAYLLVDLHGNVAAAVSSGADPEYLAGFRYDAFGQTVDAYAGGGAPSIPYRFQGRILQSAEGSTDLYDFGARSYDPSLGTFTSFDTVTRPGDRGDSRDWDQAAFASSGWRQ
jgi:RHS repeat-associated protein